MGLKKDLVNAKIQALRLAGATEPIPTEALELQVDLETSALMKFLTTCEFRITQLNAPVVLEDFKTSWGFNIKRFKFIKTWTARRAEWWFGINWLCSHRRRSRFTGCI